MKFSLTNEFREDLKIAIENKDVRFIKSSFEGASPADITELLYEFDSVKSKYVVDNIDLETASKIISELDEDTRQIFLINFESVEIAKYLEIIDSDDGADILSELSPEVRNETILSISDKEKNWPDFDEEKIK